METVDKLARIAQQYHRGIIGFGDFQAEALEIVLQDRREILDAERNGTLVTLRPDEYQP